MTATWTTRLSPEITERYGVARQVAARNEVYRAVQLPSGGRSRPPDFLPRPATAGDEVRC